MAQFRQFMPDLYVALTKIQPTLGGSAEKQAFDAYWMPLKGNTSIDYGVMERAERVAVFPVDIGWHDIGSWAALLDVLPKNEQANVVQAQHLDLESNNILAFSRNRLIATIGLKDMIIVDVDDVLLIIPADRAQDVKKLIELLKQNGMERYLV
jgi:mannose-1-phosphate guanylyltransferase